MGRYKEGRAPQGAPTDGEKDVWMADGEIILGHYVAATDEWVADAVVDSAGLVGVQGPAGEPCPTGGEADTLDTLHASAFAVAAHNHSGTYSEVLHGALTVSTSDPSGGADGDFWFKREA